MPNLKEAIRRARTTQDITPEGMWNMLLTAAKQILDERMPQLVKDVAKQLLDDKIQQQLKGPKGDKGEKGDPGKDGKDTNDIEMVARMAASFVREPSDGRPGPQGQPGYTPRAGTDYYSKEQIQELVSDFVGRAESERDSIVELKVSDAVEKATERLSLIVSEKALAELKAQLSDELKAIRRSKVAGGGGMSTPQHETFSGDGNTTSFSLNFKVAAGGNAIIVRYQGQTLDMTTHYTVSNRTVALTFTPEDGTKISITYWR